MIPLVRSAFLRGFDEFLDRRGVNGAPLFYDFGIDPSTANDESAELPANAVAAHMEAAASKSGDPCLGLNWALSFPKGGSGIYGYLILNAHTLREALANAARFGGLILHPTSANYAEVDHGGETIGVLSWRWPMDLAQPCLQYTSFLAALLTLRLRGSTIKPSDPISIQLQGNEMNCTQLVHRIFGENVTFNAPMNSIVFDAESLNQPLPTADPRLLLVIKGLGERMLAELPQRGELVNQVRVAILRRLEFSDVSLEAIANHLEMPARTLQARLAQQAETTFEAVLNEAR